VATSVTGYCPCIGDHTVDLPDLQARGFVVDSRAAADSTKLIDILVRQGQDLCGLAQHA
jgi:hypothetical protein